MRMLSLSVVTTLALLCAGAVALAGKPSPEWLRQLDRSYWVHASLGASMVKGYWGPEAPVGPLPTTDQVRNAARLLVDHYCANRLYLIYHKEIPIPDFARLLRIWRNACPRDVEIVPTLVLVMYDKEQTKGFSEAELTRLCRLFRHELSLKTVAFYDVMPKRDQGPGLAALAREFPRGLVRVGIQPEERIAPPCVAAVQDTWSGLCAGRTHDDWKLPGFGAESLRNWVRARNEEGKPVDWDLVAVAWDYLPTARGEYPGYDDGGRNMPLPAGRNRLAAELILSEASPSLLRGFSSDLLILEANSRYEQRDGLANSFYQSLKKGQPYRGYFAEPLEEIAAICRGLRDGVSPGHTPPATHQ